MNCANCINYQECLIKYQNTMLLETMELKDCCCGMWKQGENNIQTSLFDTEGEN